jgi:hypothetical protein
MADYFWLEVFVLAYDFFEDLKVAWSFPGVFSHFYLALWFFFSIYFPLQSISFGSVFIFLVFCSFLFFVLSSPFPFLDYVLVTLPLPLRQRKSSTELKVEGGSLKINILKHTLMSYSSFHLILLPLDPWV